MGNTNLESYKLLSFDKITSTQDFAHDLIAKGEATNKMVVVAQSQTAGRGRYKRTWVSHTGNLYASFIYKISERDPKLSYAIAVAVAETLIHFGLTPQIKWPNDVLIGDKKVCGILAEAQLPDYLVVGVGLNVNQKEFPNDLRRPATSLALELKIDVNVEELKEKLFSQIAGSLNKGNNNLDDFREHNYLLNKRVRVLINNEIFIGEVVGIDDSFCLQILSHDMLLHIDSGEIEIL